jgi:carbon-monoxide dehydrogenase large subunit
VIGKSVRRVEDQRFLTGSGRFVEDLDIPGALHCFLVRSPHAHALVRNITLPTAVMALTGRDMAADGIGAMRAGWGLPGMVELPRWALARDTVRHVGEPVAAVFAETRAAAQDAAEQVEVAYETLPPAEEACFRWTRGDAAAVDRAFANARHRVEIELVNNRLCGAAIENRGMAAVPGPFGLTLYCATQAPHHLRQALCAELGIGEIELRIVSPDMGGGFGYKGKHYPEETIVAWAARRLRRPVRWMAGRSESFLSDTQGRDQRTKAALALDGEGRFLALRVDTRADVGAYVSTFGAAIPGPIYSALLAGVYRTPAIYVEVNAVYSNTVPTDGYSAARRPEACYVLDRMAA